MYLIESGYFYDKIFIYLMLSTSSVIYWLMVWF